MPARHNPELSKDSVVCAARPPWSCAIINAADILVETLIAWEVKVVFGLPGDGINGIMEALRER